MIKLSEISQNIIKENVNTLTKNIRTSIKNNNVNLNKFAELIQLKQELPHLVHLERMSKLEKENRDKK